MSAQHLTWFERELLANWLGGRDRRLFSQRSVAPLGPYELGLTATANPDRIIVFRRGEPIEVNWDEIRATGQLNLLIDAHEHRWTR